MEHRNQRNHARAKRSGWHIRWSLSGYRRLTVWTGDGVILVFGDHRHAWRDLPDLLAAWRRVRRHIRRHIVLTVWTGGRAQGHNVGDLLDRQQITLLVGMTALRPFGPGFPTRGLDRRGRCRRRIGSDEGGLEEFCDVWFTRASSSARRSRSMAMKTRTSCGVACQSSSLSSGGRCGSSIAVVCQIERRLTRGYQLGGDHP
jgi:hypothetical protein